jgi:hypothetical protein
LKAILVFHHGKAKQNGAWCLPSLVSFCYKSAERGGRLEWREGKQTKQGRGACMAQKSCLAGNQQLLLRSLPITTAVRITPTRLAAIVLLQHRRKHGTYINPDRRKKYVFNV